jgi:hypothetical protein
MQKKGNSMEYVEKLLQEIELNTMGHQLKDDMDAEQGAKEHDSQADYTGLFKFVFPTRHSSDPGLNW